MMRTVVCRADTVCMSTSASFRAFIDALTFFFAIAGSASANPRSAARRRRRMRIRSRRAMVPLAMVYENARASIDDVDSKRSTTRRSNQKSIDDASMYFSTTRPSIDRPTDRPRGRDARDSFDRSSIVDATARRV